MKNINARISELENEKYSVKGAKCEVYSRVVGYLRPVSQWNIGKKEEFCQRKTFDLAQ